MIATAKQGILHTQKGHCHGRILEHKMRNQLPGLDSGVKRVALGKALAGHIHKGFNNNHSPAYPYAHCVPTASRVPSQLAKRGHLPKGSSSGKQ